MNGYVLSEDAESDLQDIYDYPEQVLGEAQAERYVFALYETFDLLAANPDIGRARIDVRAGLRSLPYRSHLVFYMPRADDIAILRVLHGKRDYGRLFDDDPIPSLSCKPLA